MKEEACCPEAVSPELLKAVADATRLRMLLALDASPRTVSEIGKFFRLSQPTITRHLQILANAGLVIRTKSAQTVTYSLAGGVLRNLCVGLMSCFPSCCGPIAHPTEISSRPVTRVRTKKQSSKSSLLKRKGGRA